MKIMTLAEWLVRKNYLKTYYYYSVLRMWKHKCISYIKYYVTKRS